MGKTKALLSVCRKHLPTILSWMAVGGVAFTGYLTHKAAKKEKSGWKSYIPPVIAGAGTIACIVGANHVHLRREAAMAAAVAFYKAGGGDISMAFVSDPSDAIKERNAQIINDRVASKNDIERYVPGASNMKLKIWEPYTKQWFEATQQEILWAELTANKMLQQRGTVTLNEVLHLYSDPSLKKKKIGNKLGWSFEDEMFCEGSGYYYCGGWIDMAPQFEEFNGVMQFVMDYGINPNDISGLER